MTIPTANASIFFPCPFPPVHLPGDPSDAERATGVPHGDKQAPRLAPDVEPNAQGPAVQAKGVRKRFGPIEALAGLDLEVRAGEIYGLLGPNGSGKTTFIRCLAGLVRPDAGEITVLGRPPRDAVAAGRIGYMTQAAALYGDLSVLENLSFFSRLEGVEHASERIDHALRTVDLLDRKRSTVSTLPGGMRQRVSLAAAL